MKEEEEDGGEFRPPRFSFLFPSRRRIVLVLDVTGAAGNGRRWERARGALFRLFSHLPTDGGAEFSLVTFGAARARVAVEPTAVTAANRHGLFGKVPFRPLEGEEDGGCVACGLETAARLLRVPSVDGAATAGSIVLVSGSETEADSLKSISEAVESAGAPVYSVALGGTPASGCDEVEWLAARSGGASFVAPESEQELQRGLGDIFLSVLNSLGGAKIKKSFERRYDLQGDRLQSGNFVVEEGLNRDLWMSVTTPHMQDIESFEVVSPSGVEHVFPHYENGIVYFHRPGMNEVGIWGYRIKPYPMADGRSVELTMEVVAEEDGGKGYKKQQISESISLEAWTNAGPEGVDASDGESVTIYASVRQGELPVRDAMVVATVRRPGSSTPVQLVLGDAGTGYPDITAGDGIYSAYFVDFTSEPGLYSLSVEATHNQGSASVPKPELEMASVFPANSSGERHDNSSSNADCCGSSVALDVYAIPTPSFEQHSAAPAFKVRRGASYEVREGEPSVVDVFPPARVTDLAVLGYDNATLFVTLSWTAPGGDLDRGRAARYLVRCYTTQEALSTNFDHTAIPMLPEELLPTPAEVGERQTATVGLPYADEVFYYGLVAVDEAGNRGQVSNLVPAFAKEVATTTELAGNAVSGDSLLSRALDDGEGFFPSLLGGSGSNGTGYIVAGVVSGLVFILVLVITISACRSARRRRAMLGKGRRMGQNVEASDKERRTQIFVDDLETPAVPPGDIIPDLTSEKAAAVASSYGGVWTTTTSAGSAADSASSATAGNHSPSSEFSQEYGYGNSSSVAPRNNNNASVASDGASWAYLSHHHHHHQVSAAPVHDYRPPSTEEDQVDHNGRVPTYQNWSHHPSQNAPVVVRSPPSDDNGTATTSSTECSESDHSDRQQQQQQLRAAATVVVGPHSGLYRRYSTDNGYQDYSASPYGPSVHDAVSVSPSYMSEKRRRQESLV